MHLIAVRPTSSTVRQSRRRSAWLFLALWFTASGTLAQTPDLPSSTSTLATDREPITPIPQAPTADPLKLALGERLFVDRRLSRDGDALLRATKEQSLRHGW
jgi:cytochrome c peroxidase